MLHQRQTKRRSETEGNNISWPGNILSTQLLHVCMGS